MRIHLVVSMAVAVALFAIIAHSAEAASAEESYRHYCGQCHGEQGKGDGINAPLISVEPRNHTDSAEMAKLSDTHLYEAIAEGGKKVNKSTLMPYYQYTFTKDEIQALVQYLRKLCNCKGP
jgi:cytochrome c553